MTQKKKPVLRFKGFTDDWEQRKLGELAEFNPKASLPDSFEYVDLESVVGTRIINHRTEKKDSAPSRAQRLAQPGDVFYQTVRPYQRNNCLFTGAEKSYVFSTGYAQLRSHGDSYFLLTMLQKDDFVNSVMDRCTGTSYPAINSNELAEINVIFPTIIQEQKELGQFFKNIDNLITLHQRKYEKLRNLKKFFLEKIFPQNGKRVPEVRFAGFTGDWEQRKLGEMLEFRNGFNGSSEIYGGDTPLISVMDILNNNFITHDKILAHVCVDNNIKERFKISYGDVLFQRSSENYEDAGTSNVYIDRQNNAIFGGFVIAGKKLKEYDPICFKYLLDSKYVRNQIIRKAQGAQHINVSQDTLQNVAIYIPNMEEQNKIGAYLHNIDHLITLHQRKLEKLQNLKKAALDKMFV